MNLINKFFNKKNENTAIYDEWILNLSYLETVKPNYSVVTHILLDDKKEQYMLIYQNNDVLFMSKSVDTDLHVVYSKIHQNMIHNTKLWECIKSSKEFGCLISNDSLVQFIIEKMEANAGYCGFKMQDEIQFWRNFSLFSQNMLTPSISIPEYKEGANTWVD